MTKKEFKKCIKADFDNNFISNQRHLKKFILLLRKCEYYRENKLVYYFYYLRYRHLEKKNLCSVPLFCFEEGISISHLCCININSNTKCGKNVRISQGVTIGSTNGSDLCPIIGDNVFIGPNACIIGNIEIANDVCIGAGAVVVKDILEPGTTWGGVPAKKISNNNSHSNLPIFFRRNIL